MLPHVSFFFFHATATTEIYTLSLHDALPIYWGFDVSHLDSHMGTVQLRPEFLDRKSTRLNSSHVRTSYAVFCLKKKNARTTSESTSSSTTSTGSTTAARPPISRTLRRARRMR